MESQPKAYLNYILFDNQFNLVAANSGAMQVLPGSSKQALIAPLQEVTKSGYMYVYVSNESPQDVYFDDVTVTHTTGPLLQENHYYPYGLSMATISDKAALKLKNNYLYNGGAELEDEDGITYYNTFYRKYDAQTGRFTGIDMMAESYTGLNPYQFAANNPVMFNDPMGDFLGENGPDLSLGRFGKGRDNNYHQDWVNSMIPSDFSRGFSKDMWNDLLTFIGTFDFQSSGGGNYYQTPDEAAIAWGKEYYDITHSLKTEFASLIFGNVDVYGNLGYSYSDGITVIGTRYEEWKDQRSPGPDDIAHILPEGAWAVGHIHSHLNLSGAVYMDDSHSFSDGDNKKVMNNSRHNFDFYNVKYDGSLYVLRKDGNRPEQLTSYSNHVITPLGLYMNPGFLGHSIPFYINPAISPAKPYQSPFPKFKTF